MKCGSGLAIATAYGAVQGRLVKALQTARKARPPGPTGFRVNLLAASDSLRAFGSSIHCGGFQHGHAGIGVEGADEPESGERQDHDLRGDEDRAASRGIRCPPCAWPWESRAAACRWTKSLAVRLLADAPLRRRRSRRVRRGARARCSRRRTALSIGTTTKNDARRRLAMQLTIAAGADPPCARQTSAIPGDEVGPGGEADEYGRSDVGGGMQIPS